MKRSDFKIGQEVYLAYDDSRRQGGNRVLVVSKIGIKWITLDNGARFDPETMRVDGDPSYATIHLSKEAYEVKQALDKAFTEFKRKVCYTHRLEDAVTIEDIMRAAKLMGIELEIKP